MKLKNFVNILVFSVIGFVLSMIGGYSAYIFGPYMFYVNNAIAAVLVAPVYILLCRRLMIKGSVFYFYAISGIIYLPMSLWQMTVITVLVGIVGEVLMLKAGSYQDNKRIGLSYLVSQFLYALHGFAFIVIFGVKGVTEQFQGMFTLEQAQSIHDFFTNPLNLSITIAIQIIVSTLGFALGLQIYKKFFAKIKSKQESRFNEN